MEERGLGSFVPHTDCEISGDLAPTSAEGRLQGTPSLIAGGMILEIRWVPVLRLVHCHLTVTSGSPGRDLMSLSPSPGFYRRQQRLQWALLTPESLGGCGHCVTAQTSHSPCRALSAAWALSAVNVGGSPFAELSGHPHTRCSRQGAHL